MELAVFFKILIVGIFINNFVFSQFLGICPYMGVSNRLDSAIGMGTAVIFVMVLSAVLAWVLECFFLAPTAQNIWFRLFGDGSNMAAFDFRYLRTIVFILSIAALVQVVEIFMKKFTPAMYEMLGIYLPLITTNCCVLGVVIINVNEYGTDGVGLMKSITNAAGGGLGFSVALLIMAGVRERMDETVQYIPKPFKGAAIIFIVAALMSLAFMGFMGL
jgi:Na+-translocating ferredoxin:NAD+ oxidoreductase subunit A